MALRSLFLRIALYALLITAVVGGILVIFGSGYYAGYAVGSGVLCAVAGALLAPVLNWVGQPRIAVAGVTGAVCIVGALLVALGAIWIPEVWSGWWIREHLAFTSLSIIGCALPATLLLRFRETPAMSLASPGGTALSALVFTALMAQIWLDLGWRYEEVLANLVWFAATSTLCVINHGRDKRHWRWLGVAAGLAAVVWAAAESTQPSYGVPDSIQYCWCLAIPITYANTVLAFRLKRSAALLRGTCMALVFGAAGLWAYTVSVGSRLDTFAGEYSLTYRLFAAISLAAGCGTVALIILHWLTGRREIAPGSPLPTATTVVCPRCYRKQRQDFGESACKGCGTLLSVRAFDPKCPSCGYDLAGITTPRCPECSTEVLLRPARLTPYPPADAS